MSEGLFIYPDLLLFRSIRERRHAIEVELIEQLIGSAHSLNGQTTGSNTITTDERILHRLGTSHRQFLVQLRITLRRSITLDENLRLRMILHILGNHRHAGHLGCIDRTLTLTEDNGGLEHIVVHHLRHPRHLVNYRSLHLLCSLERILKFCDTTDITSNTTILAIALIAKFVDARIQVVNLRLVAQTSKSKVLGAAGTVHYESQT